MTGLPYLSVVVTSRNDNHGGTLLRRMQIFCDCLIAQCKRHALTAELIVVEWNPPADRGPLIEALKWPADPGPCAVRFITVPPEVHARYKHGKHLPLYQMIAKNVGIRRARGEFILATNIDVILNDELAAFIAQRKLERGRMYRIDRTDADALVPEGAPLNDVLAYCKSHVLRVNAREGTFPIGPNGMRIPAPVDVTQHEAVVSLGAGWYEPQRDAEGHPSRWVDNDAEIWLRHATAADAHRPLYMTLDLQPGPAAGNDPLLLTVTDGNDATLLRQRIFSRRRVSFPVHLRADQLQAVTLHIDRLSERTCTSAFDPRRLNFQVHHIDLSSSPPPPPSAEDQQKDIHADGIVLGEGWFPLESAFDRPFRWLDTGADIWVEAPGHPFVEIDLEPGPSLGHTPFLLHVDRSGAEPLALGVVGRRTLRIPLPHNATSDLARLTFRIDGPRLRIPGDARILNAKIHAIRLSDAPAASRGATQDVAAEGLDIAFGPGWHGPEQHEGQWFRWADNDARLWIASHASANHPASAQLRITPGPSHSQTPGPLSVTTPDGRTVAHLPGASGILTLPLNGPLCQFTLHVDSPSTPVPNDSRLLNFKLDGLSLHPGCLPPSDAPADTPPSQPPCTQTLPAHALAPAMPAFLHTNACGDFTLLHRDHWFDLRGYAEWDVFSLNIDSLFCYTAHHGGAREAVLAEPMCLYHIEHNVGSGWTPEGQQILINRIRAQGIPDVHWTEVAHLGGLMNQYDAPILFCRDDWGLIHDELPQQQLNADVQAP